MEIEPITAGQFYKHHYRWWQLVKRYKWKRNPTIVAYKFAPTAIKESGER